MLFTGWEVRPGKIFCLGLLPSQLQKVKTRQKHDHVDVFEKRFFLDKKLLKAFPITKQNKMR